MMEVGQTMEWHRYVTNYGFHTVTRVKVLKIGKRVTIEVPLKGGGTRISHAPPQNLKPIPRDR